MSRNWLSQAVANFGTDIAVAGFIVLVGESFDFVDRV